MHVTCDLSRFSIATASSCHCFHLTSDPCLVFFVISWICRPLFFFQRGIPKFIETLNFRKLKVGMQVLGAVREINELDLVVSLPNGLAGYVSLAESVLCTTCFMSNFFSLGYHGTNSMS